VVQAPVLRNTPYRTHDFSLDGANAPTGPATIHRSPLNRESLDTRNSGRPLVDRWDPCADFRCLDSDSTAAPCSVRW
jgi:hypothetical protein